MVSALLTVLLISTPAKPIVDDGLHRIKLPNAKNAEGQAIEVFAEFTPSRRETDDPNEITNRIVTRPENLADKFSITPRWEYSPADDMSMTSAFFALRANGGDDNVGREVMRGIDTVRDYIDREAKEKEDISPNAFIKPDGWTTRDYGLRKHEQTVTCTIFTEYKQGSIDSRNVIEIVDIPIGYYWEPSFAPLAETFVPDDNPEKKFLDKIGGLFVEPANGSGEAVCVFLPTFDKPIESVSGGVYAAELLKDNGGVRLTTSLADIGYKITDFPKKINEMAPSGTDMNDLQFPQIENPCLSDFYIPPGIVWYPNNPAYQTMTTGVRTHIDYRNLFSAALDLALQSAPNQMRVLCMNMQKKEPAAGIKYFPARSKDPIITQLANKMDQTNYRGPWDQARLWIYTDKASMEEINKRITPDLSPSAYLLGLADVGQAGGLDPKMLKDEKIMRPDLLLGPGAPPYCVQFLLNNFDENLPNKVGEYLAKSGQELLRLSGGDKYATDHLTNVLKRLLDFKSPKDRMALLQALEKAGANLGAIKGTFGSGRVSLYSADPKEVLLALSLAEKGVLAKSQDSLTYLASSGANAEIKAKAQKLVTP